MPEAKSTHAAFISHASQDREKALEICESLEARGLKCWIAPRDVRPGRDFPEEIVSGIMNSRCFVLVLSEAANESPFVKKELERAVSYRKPIFPVRIEEVMPSPALELLVSATQWIDAWSGSLVDHIDQLVVQFNSADCDMSLSPPPQTAAAKLKRFIRRRTGLAVAAAASLLAVLIILLLLLQPGGLGEKYLWPRTLADLQAADFQVSPYAFAYQAKGRRRILCSFTLPIPPCEP